MLKKEIEFETVNSKNEIENVKEKAFFHYSLKCIKNYNEMTNGNLLQDINKVWKIITQNYLPQITKFQELRGKEIQDKEMSSEEILGFVGFADVLTNPEIANFMMSAVPCFYCRIINGKIIQDSETIDECLNSDWFMNLINFEFFMELFEEINKFSDKLLADNKKSSKKK
jgi:hypothetical protein